MKGELKSKRRTLCNDNVKLDDVQVLQGAHDLAV